MPTDEHLVQARDHSIGKGEMMSGIFINYRQRPEHTWLIRALRERLTDHFGEGEVFLNERCIDLGKDYRSELSHRVIDADVVISVIHRE
ncbi:MAG TPA: hypothetical protein VLJ59_10625 [Mycobacteriales bacterium]|nr:hypothetical protein [Mycobacteriales bacterium]